MNLLSRTGAFVMVFVMAAALAACNEPAVMYEMAAFDRAYIPALMLTAQPDGSEKTVMAVTELKLEFMIFKSRNAEYIGWDESLGKIEDMIMKADLNINAGDSETAHSALEGIRHEMYELRKDADIKDYILDRLTEFHEVMEQIAAVVNGKSPQALRQVDIMRIRELLPLARERWESVAASPFNPKVFRFSSGKTEKLMVQIENERKVLKSLDEVVKRQNQEMILLAVREMKEEYATTIKLFGNFGSLSLGPG